MAAVPDSQSSGGEEQSVEELVCVADTEDTEPFFYDADMPSPGCSPVQARAAEKKRGSVARELLETEETYCAGLRFLVDDCLVPLRTTRLASPATIAAIFLNVEDLLRHSTTLVTTLRTVVSAWDTSSVLAKPFNSLVCNFLSSGVFVFPLHCLCVSHVGVDA